ncbi:MAG TPA: AtpZ/AtpI family protein [Phycisphaerae bacterium]|jgi:F0F1-type ATP synthase assembly protein I|nr:AtpZ/AtpI family protein [Phycisphaerae bacterium]
MAQEPSPEEKPSRDSSIPPTEKDKIVGWIDNLAQRSAGLPQDRPAKEKGKSPWSTAGKGLQFAATTALFALMGWWLDRRFGWTPWGTVGLSMLGFIGGLYLLIKEGLTDQDQSDK